MKFRQVAKNLFQLGITNYVVLKNFDGHWTLGLLKGEDVLLSNHHFYTRKGAGKWTSRAKESDFVVAKKMSDFGEPQKRPPPPRPFIELLRKL